MTYTKEIELFLKDFSKSSPYTVEKLTGGGNNRAYKVQVGTERFLLKEYFRHPSDTRDRLATEYGFCEAAWKYGLTKTPRAICKDNKFGLALYSFISGRPCAIAEVTADNVRKFLGFLKELSVVFKSAIDSGATLPLASEPCFTISEHVTNLSNRLERLSLIDPSAPLGQEAQTFVRSQLLPLAEQELSKLRGMPLERELHVSERILSPSDFGFHNAIVTDNGDLTFVDFEYAGIDDPARTLCDFFIQPRIPVPFEYADTFVRELGEITGDEGYLQKRFNLLMPIYRLKWCCIVLGEFLPVSAARRVHAQAGADITEERRKRQLGRARRIIGSF